MSSAYSVFTMINILIAIYIAYYMIKPSCHSCYLKFMHFLLVTISGVELLSFISLNIYDSNSTGLLLSIIIQIIWSGVLLYTFFQNETEKNKNTLLEAELKKHQSLYEEIKSLALSDSLTNIANRRNFDMFLQTELRRACSLDKPVSLIIMDLDRFKTYNDTFGHLSGDKLLAQIGQILRHHVRANDLPARYGGEEFSIILPGSGLDEAILIAEKLRQIIENSNFPDHSGTFTAKITASFGIATYDPQILMRPPDSEKIISIADKALYKAKQQGRNRVFASMIFQ